MKFPCTLLKGRQAHPVLPEHLGCLPLVVEGQPDVWEGGEVVAEVLTHLHLDGLTGRGCGGDGTGAVAKRI